MAKLSRRKAGGPPLLSDVRQELTTVAQGWRRLKRGAGGDRSAAWGVGKGSQGQRQGGGEFEQHEGGQEAGQTSGQVEGHGMRQEEIHVAEESDPHRVIQKDNWTGGTPDFMTKASKESNQMTTTFLLSPYQSALVSPLSSVTSVNHCSVSSQAKPISSSGFDTISHGLPQLSANLQYCNTGQRIGNDSVVRKFDLFGGSSTVTASRPVDSSSSSNTVSTGSLMEAPLCPPGCLWKSPLVPSGGPPCPPILPHAQSHVACRRKRF